MHKKKGGAKAPPSKPIKSYSFLWFSDNFKKSTNHQ